MTRMLGVDPVRHEAEPGCEGEMKVRVSYDIDLDDRYELASKEPVLPKRGDHYIDDHGHVCVSTLNFRNARYFIVRPRWQWPAWLKARWLWSSVDGTSWIVANDKPGIFEHHQIAFGAVKLCSHCVDFTPPPLPGLYENPNWQSEQHSA